MLKYPKSGDQVFPSYNIVGVVRFRSESGGLKVDPGRWAGGEREEGQVLIRSDWSTHPTETRCPPRDIHHAHVRTDSALQGKVTELYVSCFHGSMDPNTHVKTEKYIYSMYLKKMTLKVHYVTLRHYIDITLSVLNGLFGPNHQ